MCSHLDYNNASIELFIGASSNFEMSNRALDGSNSAWMSSNSDDAPRVSFQLAPSNTEVKIGGFSVKVLYAISIEYKVIDSSTETVLDSGVSREYSKFP